MSSISLTEPAPVLAPVAGSERIQALDVVRGFALIGIFLMNVEFFSRPVGEIGQGLPAGASGIHWLAGWLIYMFVQGKFWTMFSLLFGMGFAVMLSRAERAGRSFLVPYLRRIAALAVFGALHHIFIWSGDILFSYAVGAVGLLLLLFGNWKYLLGSLVAMLGLGFVPGLGGFHEVAASFALVNIAALFLRGEWTLGLGARRLPVFSLVFLVLGLVAAAFAALLWANPDGSAEQRVPTTIIAGVLLAIGVLSARFHQPVEARPRRLGVAMYLLPFLMMTTFGVVQYLSPAAPPPAPAPPPMESAAGAAPSKAASQASASPAEKAKADRGKWQLEQKQRVIDETRIMSAGSYSEAIQYRASEFARNASGTTGFAILIIGMFLIGAWFVRSGVMENTAAHLPLFRKLAWYGIPLGVGLGLLGSMIATTATPGLDKDPYQIALGMLFLGNLPACLGYVGAVVLMLHSRGVLARIAGLAPLGRMALTNYLLASLVGTWTFYGYGLGQWGMGRAWQVVFVAVVIVLQLLLSRWWLARYRYGPMEWLWRAITYWQVPPMRRDDSSALQPRHATG